MFHSGIVSQLFGITKYYGRKKLAIVILVTFLQGFTQILGVTSIFPFLALASDPSQFRDSKLGSRLLSVLPEIDDDTMLIYAGLIAIIFLFSANVFLLLGEIVRIRYAQGLGHWLRIRLLDHIVGNSYSYFLNANTGELLKKMNLDVSQMINSAVIPILDGYSRILTVLLLVITLILFDPLLAIISATIVGGFYFLVMLFFKNLRVRHSAEFKVANRGAMRESQQLLGGIKTIKIHQKEKYFLDRFAHHSVNQANIQKWFPLYVNSPRYLIEPVAFGLLVALVIVTTARGGDLITLMPKLGVLALAGYRLIPNLQLIYVSLSQVGVMAHSVEEVADEIEYAQRNQKNTDRNYVAKEIKPLEWRNSVSFRDLSFKYASSTKLLFEEINFQIPKNSFVAIVGETGSGKTTLVDLLLGLHEPCFGEICVDEHTLKNDDSMRAWRSSIGYVPQDIFLVDDTIAANIALGIPKDCIDLKKVKEAAEIAHISDFIEHEMPGSYQGMVGERGVKLSGGQRQRVGLARALYSEPSTLILDEATSALDNNTETAVMAAIQALHGKITLVVIAHRLSTIEKADIVYKVQDGVVNVCD